jgi:hypothetical protein
VPLLDKGIGRGLEQVMASANLINDMFCN